MRPAMPLPDESAPEQMMELTREEMQRQREQKEERLQVFSQVIASRLKDAIVERQNSGIEEEWEEDDDAYEGIDDANRSDEKYLASKPIGDGVQTSAKGAPSTRSNVFLNITRPYVDASSSRVGDMLLPTDDWPWAIDPTPMPDMESALDGPAADEAVQLPDGSSARKGDVAQSLLAEARKRSDAAQEHIRDWQIESQWHAEVRKVIEDTARIGTGVLKGPYPVKKRSKSWRTDTKTGVTTLIMKESIVPASRRIDPKNLYPDPSCGEDIHNGSHIFERDLITSKQLRELKGIPGYLEYQIDMALEEGPVMATMVAKRDRHGSNTEKDQYEIWYYHGSVDAKDMNAIGCPCGEGESAFALITMVNNRVIKAVLNPLDTGEFPYDVMIWQRRSGTWTGIGVARQISVPQRMVNAGCRNLMDNAGLGSGPQIFMRDGKVVPADGSWKITPRKIWKIDADAEGRVEDFFDTIVIPMIERELMEIVQFALKMAEDVTGLPMIMQGQQGKAPETVGGMTMLYNNASSVLRRIARLFDDRLTEPHIRRYYDWLMQYSENPDEKGDFQINAVGSSALVERDLQNQEMMAMAQMVLNPVFGLDPKKWAQEFLKSRRFDPARFELSDEDKKKMEQAAQQGPPPDPRIEGAKEVATIRAQGDIKKAELVNDADITEIERKIADAREARQHEQEMKMLDYNIAIMKLSNEKGISIDQIKASLAKESMKLNTQRELSAASMGADLDKHYNPSPQVATPPTEPAGRADTGKAFQQ